MPRPRKHRWVEAAPRADFYAPRGVPLEELRGIVLTVEGLESLRLVDARRFDHETAAALMGVSRPTFSRILAEARGAVATALTNGWALRIDGGDYRLAGTDDDPGHGPGGGRHPGYGRGPSGGRGRGRRQGGRGGRFLADEEGDP